MRAFPHVKVSKAIRVGGGAVEAGVRGEDAVANPFCPVGSIFPTGS